MVLCVVSTLYLLLLLPAAAAAVNFYLLYLKKIFGPFVQHLV